MSTEIDELYFGRCCLHLYNTYFIRSVSSQNKMNGYRITSKTHFLNKNWDRISFTHFNKVKADGGFNGLGDRRLSISLNIDNHAASINKTGYTAMKQSIRTIKNFNPNDHILHNMTVRDQLDYKNTIVKVYHAIIEVDPAMLPTVDEVQQSKEMYNHNKTANKLINL